MGGGVDHPVDHLQRKRIDRSVDPDHGGVDDHVDLTVTGASLGHQLVHGVAVADVGGHGDDGRGGMGAPGGGVYAGPGSPTWSPVVSERRSPPP